MRHQKSFKPMEPLQYEQALKAKNTPDIAPGYAVALVVLALTRSLAFFLALYAGFVIVFPFANLAQDASLCGSSFKATKGGVQSFIIFNSNL